MSGIPTSPHPESIDFAPGSPLSCDEADSFEHDELLGKILETKVNKEMPDVVLEEDGVEPFMRIKKELGKYCTTSTVYAEHTIMNPNYDQVIFCIAAIIQAQIFEDFSFSDEMKNKYVEYNIDVKLPPEYGGEMDTVPESILNHETMNDQELREMILRGVVPTIDTIFRFINLLYKNAKYSPECNIIALIYVNRLTSAGKIPLTMSNFRGIWISAIVLAQKVWDDNPLRTSQFNIILPSVSKTCLRDLERKTLCLIEFTTNVKPSLYAKYYFELRTLFTDITGNDAIFQWNLKPLTIIESKQLDMRTKRSVLEIRGARAMGDTSILSTPKELSPVDPKRRAGSGGRDISKNGTALTATGTATESRGLVGSSSSGIAASGLIGGVPSETPRTAARTVARSTAAGAGTGAAKTGGESGSVVSRSTTVNKTGRSKNNQLTPLQNNTLEDFTRVDTTRGLRKIRTSRLMLEGEGLQC